MRTKLFVLNFVLILLISLAVIFNGCKKDQQGEMEQPTEAAETEPSLTEQLEQDVKDVIKPFEEKGTELKQEMDDLLAKIKKYEQTLVTKQAELSQQADSIKVKKDELQKWEGSLKSYRTASWIVFLIGLVLFIIGLVLFLLARKKAATDKAEKEQIKLTKAAEKEEKKTEKNLKKNTPPKE
jgi:large-conductance mechanosensitive channel